MEKDTLPEGKGPDFLVRRDLPGSGQVRLHPHLISRRIANKAVKNHIHGGPINRGGCPMGIERLEISGIKGNIDNLLLCQLLGSGHQKPSTRSSKQPTSNRQNFSFPYFLLSLMTPLFCHSLLSLDEPLVLQVILRHGFRFQLLSVHRYNSSWPCLISLIFPASLFKISATCGAFARRSILTTGAA